MCSVQGTRPGLGMVMLTLVWYRASASSLLLCAIDDAVQIQGAVIVHGQDDVGVSDVGLHLRQLLQGMEHRLTSSTPLPGPQFPSMPPPKALWGSLKREKLSGKSS